MTGETIELRDPATQHAQRFAVVSWGAIGVSFLHMAGAMTLYSGELWYEKAIAGAMVLMVDLAIWATAGYRLYCRQFGRQPHWIVEAMFALAVITSISLNGLAIWSHRPDETVAPGLVSALVAIVFSLLISGFIVAASVVDGEIGHDRQSTGDVRAELATLRDEAEQLRGQLAVATRQLADVDRARLLLLPSAEAAPALQRERDALAAQVLELQATARAEAAHAPRTIARLESELEGARAIVARSEATSAQHQQEIAQHRAEAEQERAASAQLRSEVAQVRAALDEARAAAGLDLQGIARAARDREVPAREIARVLGKSDSTVRAWIGKE